MLFGLPLRHVNAVAVALVFVLSLLAFSSTGIMSATFTLVFKRRDPLLWLFGSGSWLLGGVLYPIDVLPASLQHLSRLLPITHAAEGMRAALLGGASPALISARAVSFVGARCGPTEPCRRTVDDSVHVRKRQERGRPSGVR